MATELCMCSTVKTRNYVTENGNRCPQCDKFLIDESLYLKPSPEWDSNDLKTNKLKSLVENMAFRKENDVARLKLSTFSGGEGENPAHFFLKLENIFTAYHIVKEEEKIRIFKQSINSKGVDLFMSLDENTQGDISAFAAL